MCGIAGVHSLTGKPIPRVGELANSLLRGIASRGSDATGLLALYEDGTTHLEKQLIPAPKFVLGRAKFPTSPRTVLLHTRWATVGSRKLVANAHPVQWGDCFATHNGTIWNDDELFRLFDLTRKAEVDSEIIPALVHFAGWDHVTQALELLSGGAAVALVNRTAPTELVLARTTSFPLVYSVIRKRFVVWASTEEALKRACKESDFLAPRSFTHLAEGELVRVKDGKLLHSTFRPKAEVFTWRRSQPAAATVWAPRRKKRRRKSVTQYLYPVDRADLTAEYEWVDDVWTATSSLFGFCDDCGDWDELQRQFESQLCSTCASSVERFVSL